MIELIKQYLSKEIVAVMDGGNIFTGTLLDILSNQYCIMEKIVNYPSMDRKFVEL